MSECSKHLGKSVFRKRKQLKMTQAGLAERTGVTEQTIRKIEHGEGNPQLDVLDSLVTALQIDPTKIFFPMENGENVARKQLEILLADCSDSQIRELIPVIRAALGIIKSRCLASAK